MRDDEDCPDIRRRVGDVTSQRRMRRVSIIRHPHPSVLPASFPGPGPTAGWESLLRMSYMQRSLANRQIISSLKNRYTEGQTPLCTFPDTLEPSQALLANLFLVPSAGIGMTIYSTSAPVCHPSCTEIANGLHPADWTCPDFFESRDPVHDDLVLHLHGRWNYHGVSFSVPTYDSIIGKETSARHVQTVRARLHSFYHPTRIICSLYAYYLFVVATQPWIPHVSRGQRSVRNIKDRCCLVEPQGQHSLDGQAIADSVLVCI